MPETFSPSVDGSDSLRLSRFFGKLFYGDLPRNYWVFFAIALFFDAGFAIYFFLFNLYLLDAHFTERAIGLINGAFTLGSTLMTLPAGLLANRFGVKRLLFATLLLSPLLGVVRVVFLATPLQILFGFLAGAAMCLWGVAYLPAVARLTSDESRASGYSLIFCASIVTSAIGGAVSAYLPRLQHHALFPISDLLVHRRILLTACAIALAAVWPAVYLNLGSSKDTKATTTNLMSMFRLSPFLIRFLPCMALWAASMGAFLPFANVYLVREHFVTMQNIGFVFSIGQVLQLLLGLMTPVIISGLGMRRGTLSMQLVTTVCLIGLAYSRSGIFAVVLYLFFSAAQWMCSPALYNMLMTQVEDEERSQAAAMVMFLNALLSSLAVTLAGASFTQFGYASPLVFIACIGIAASLCLFLFAHSVSPQGDL